MTHAALSDNPPSRKRRWIVASAVVVVLAGAAGTAFLLNGDEAPKATSPKTTPAPTTEPTKAQPVKSIGTPDRLAISAIGVDAPVISVGTTAKGAQDVPGSLDATGWWRDGSKPGQPGNAVIVGHTASKGDGVFDELGDLNKGDKITVSSGKDMLTYTVTKEQVLEVSKFATVADEIYRRTGPSGIVLMTCGDWNGTRFETTVIVTAKLKVEAGVGTWSR